MSFLNSPSGEDPVELEALYRASRERVFAAFVEPAKFHQWFGRGAKAVSVSIDARLGGAWRAVFEDGPDGKAYLEGSYTEYDPVSRLAFTWRHVLEKGDGGRSESAMSQVAITLEEEGAATRLRLRHVGVSAEGRKNVTPGWIASLASLEKLLSESA